MYSGATGLLGLTLGACANGSQVVLANRINANQAFREQRNRKLAYENRPALTDG
jgi:hypothetical protein